MLCLKMPFPWLLYALINCRRQGAACSFELCPLIQYNLMHTIRLIHHPFAAGTCWFPLMDMSFGSGICWQFVNRTQQVGWLVVLVPCSSTCFSTDILMVWSCRVKLNIINGLIDTLTSWHTCIRDRRCQLDVHPTEEVISNVWVSKWLGWLSGVTVGPFGDIPWGELRTELEVGQNS